MRRNLLTSLNSELEKHLKKKDKIVVGVSGGGDSTALLHLLIRSPLNLAISVCHFNHCLRGAESDKDEKFVEDLCNKKKIPFYVKKFDILRASVYLKKGVEETSRLFRRKFLKRIQEETKSKKILLAHHSNDQVETFFMRLLRGSSLKGLQSMKVDEGSYLRPFLHVSKTEITEFLVSESIQWVEDETNTWDKYTRNNIRKNLIPILEKFNPNLNSTISNTIELIGKQNGYMESHIKAIGSSLVKEVSEHEFVILIDSLLALSEFEVEEVLFRFLSKKAGSRDFIGYKNIKDIVKLITSPSASGELFLAGNIKVEKGYNFLFIKTKISTSMNFHLNIASEGKWKNEDLEIKIQKDNFERGNEYIFFDLSKMKFPINVRNFQDGDRMKLKGMKSSKKLQDIFVDNKIPRFIRARLPIFESQGSIFHIHGINVNSPLRLKRYQENSIGISVKSENLDKLIKNINY